jgi:endonuclease YncB( thermonuclease family)
MKRFDELAMVGITILMIILAVLLAYSARAETCMSMTVHPEQVLGNYDGDTFTVSLGALGGMKLRVQDIDTPERTKKQPGWEEAKTFTQHWLAAGPFDLWTCFAFTFGRVVAVASRDGVTLAEALEAAGYAKE